MPGYVPKPGFQRNPLKNHRNVACFCGSRKKAKRCHGLFDLLPDADVKRIKEYLRVLSMAGVILATQSEITYAPTVKTEEKSA